MPDVAPHGLGVERAKVPDRRLHDARHTAAPVLLLLGVTERTVMAIMGWSNTAMAARYQHVIAAIRKDVATQVGGLLWEAPRSARRPRSGRPTTLRPVPSQQPERTN
ncbi:tyrosine-type recombinase/integrase [Kutzneria sp. NPDC052558]|uniref:tyrosine-type recombinase/integrase n=1 Tax=Kutzneria sp. NPDC052558 TaxID=3364121 RepID=UPI0037C5E2BF